MKHKALLIHGFSASTFSFRNNIDTLLANNTLVVVMDMPSFGYSDKSEYANYTDSNKIMGIHYVLKMIDKLSNNQKWNLIGHSMGGTVIGQFASKHAEQTQSLIFIDGLPYSQTHSQFQNLALYPPILKWADIILEKKFLDLTSFNALLSSAYNLPADKKSTEGYMKPFQNIGSGSAIFRMAANSGYVSIIDAKINSIPKLIIWGKTINGFQLKMQKNSF